MVETLDKDYHKADEHHCQVSAKPFDDGKNVRLLVNLNLSASTPYSEILDVKQGPPLALLVVRADMKFVALGLLEDLKFQIQKMHSVPKAESKLTAGVGQFAKKLIH